MQSTIFWLSLLCILSLDPPLDENARHHWLMILVLIYLAFQIGGQMIPGPMVRIIESIVCESYWRLHDPNQFTTSGRVPEQFCKISEIQMEVTTVKGYSDFLEGLLSALCAIPYGMLADRYGRRQALRLTVPGFILNAIITNSVLWFSDLFPLRTIWLAALSWAIGGGPTVAVVAIWTMIADLTTGSTRTTVFFQVGVASMTAEFIARVIGSGLMTLNPWISLMLGCGIVVIGLTFALSLPETMNNTRRIAPLRAADTAAFDELHPILDRESIDISERSQPKISRHCSIAAKARAIISPYGFLSNHTILMALLACTTYQFANGSSWLLAQYISSRLGWSLAGSNLLVSSQAAISIVLFLFILPCLSTKVLFVFSPLQKDLYLAQASSACLIVGTLGISLSSHISILAPSLAFQAVGAGFPYLIKSVVTALVKQEETARLYSVVELLQSVATMLSSLCLTSLFTAGLHLGGVWVGLAWLISGSLFAIVEVVLWML
ncbi:putative MFS transporter [Aspergillus pseudonomiae]|uniref:Putative MFS transporter n=1 Tax=Aspergillus pseudonomiae TaxID=1506151 RepID=A0A5N7D0Z5_9EURO|nr:putative MFS transporter [Aspergillus pseudonomiae]KAE8400086.1 putative MFS transporter [Aspergillus pseudonomiae]